MGGNANQLGDNIWKSVCLCILSFVCSFGGYNTSAAISAVHLWLISRDTHKVFRLTVSLLIHHLERSFFFLSYFNLLAQIKGGKKILAHKIEWIVIILNSVFKKLCLIHNLIIYFYNMLSLLCCKYGNCSHLFLSSEWENSGSDQLCYLSKSPEGDMHR